MSIESHSRYRRRPVAVLAVLLVLTGVLTVSIGVRGQHHAPQPPASAAIAVDGTAGAVAPTAAAAAVGSPVRVTPSPPSSGPVLPRSVPVGLSIPSIGVSSGLLQLGINADHSVQVPPLSRNSEAGWYRGSPTPGQLGPALLLGHVDSAQYGAGIFYKLGAVRPGNTITVTRADHTTAVFRVDRVAIYPKDHFPTYQVYGNTTNAALRLITCGGKFDFTHRSYLSNIVVYADLVSSHLTR